MTSNEKHIDEILARGVSTFVDPEGKFKQKLLSSPQNVVVKWGVDITRPDLHLGHAVVLRKLRQLQDLGCKVIFLIGDYTTMIGDPTGKSKVRPEISQQEIEANLKTYLDQVGKILLLDEKVFSWIKNSDWYLDVTDIAAGKGTTITINDAENKNHITVDANSFVGKAVLFDSTRMQKTHLKKNITHTVSFTRILATLKHITHARLIERDMFKDRIASGSELYMHEMLYPVLQGIDSAVLARIYGACDIEAGGSDQTFNMLMGRDVMKMNKQEPQSVIAFELLVGLDGKEKMSKSLDNYIGITDEPSDMYGKVMSLADLQIVHYFELCTYAPLDEIREIEKQLQLGKKNPKDFKMRLAREIVAIYHGETKAKEAEEDFITKFQKKEIPENIEEIEGDGELGELLVEKKIIESKSEWRRLVEGGAVTNLTTDSKIDDSHALAKSGVYKIGKHRFVKIKNT